MCFLDLHPQIEPKCVHHVLQPRRAQSSVRSRFQRQHGVSATNAYRHDFDWSMLIGIDIPTIGCWEITGHYEDEEPSFVVWVAP